MIILFLFLIINNIIFFQYSELSQEPQLSLIEDTSLSRTTKSAPFLFLVKKEICYDVFVRF